MADQAKTKGRIMDWQGFTADVLESVNNSLFTDQAGSLDNSGEDYTGVVLTIGETWQGSLYGLTEYEDGTHNVHLFGTEREQREWFDSHAEGDL